MGVSRRVLHAPLMTSEWDGPQMADNGVMHILEDMIYAPSLYEECVSLSPALPQGYLNDTSRAKSCVRLA